MYQYTTGFKSKDGIVHLKIMDAKNNNCCIVTIFPDNTVNADFINEYNNDYTSGNRAVYHIELEKRESNFGCDVKKNWKTEVYNNKNYPSGVGGNPIQYIK